MNEETTGRGSQPMSVADWLARELAKCEPLSAGQLRRLAVILREN